MYFVNQKTLKGKQKKKWKEIKWTKVPVQLKKIRIEKFKTQLKKRHCRTSTSRRYRSRCKSVDEDVIKFKSMKCKNRGDRRRVWLRVNKKNN